jgi:hypothetical protein
MTAVSSKSIQKMILELLEQRESTSTICPSEVARALSSDWRDLMPQVRVCADELHSRGLIEILQKGKAVPSAVDAHGPLRLSLKR